jgi:tRNA (cmo5U34)-methyltransferase
MLEKMSEFFENRLDSYDNHMLTEIEKADEFYPFTASLLPKDENAKILDLGCGTGLELREYYLRCPDAAVTGIDLSEKMLRRLAELLPGKPLRLLCGSYFDLPLGVGVYHAAVSVESLHHFTKEEKCRLYRKLNAALKEGGYFILTDYFACDDAEEQRLRAELLRLMACEGASSEEIYHYDTPLTVAHEVEALLEGGFDRVEVLRHWGATYTLKAMKSDRT